MFSILDESTITIRGERFTRYLDAERIRERVAELGAEIAAAFPDKRPILVGVLNGAFIFLADLMREIRIECEVDFIKLSSYGDDRHSSGKVRELKKIDADLEGRHVIVVEDIVDTGLSMQFLMERLAAHDPASIHSATLLHKPDATRVDLSLDFVGFRIPDLFVVGYGLDYGQIGRNLPNIYILDASPNDSTPNDD